MIYMKSKKELRKEVLSTRKSLSTEDVIEKSLVITDKLRSLKEFEKSSVVMAYMDFDNEVKTGYIIEYCMKEGKRLILPLVETKGPFKRIEAYEVKDTKKDLKRGTYGIYEPDKSLTSIINPETIDFVIVPGVAFDICRNRIGYGAGYYDAFLKRLGSGCFKAGIAFDFQVYQHIPVEPHDVPLDTVITEERFI